MTRSQPVSHWLKAMRLRSRYLLLGLISAICVATLSSAALSSSPLTPPAQLALLAEAPPPSYVPPSLSQAQQLYDQERYPQAAQVLQQVIEASHARDDRAGQIVALRNLALVHHRLSQWEQGNQAVTTALSLLPSLNEAERSPLFASVRDVQGSLQFEQGQFAAALTSWEESAALYTQLGNSAKATQSQINQAQALQRLGFYRRAIATLDPIANTLSEQPDSVSKAVALRSLGDGLVFVGELERAKPVLESSLQMAQQLNLPDEASAAALSLGNLLRDQNNPEAALAMYERAAAANAPPITRIQSQLNQLSVLMQTDRATKARTLWPQIQTELEAQPPGQSVLFARVNLAQQLLKLNATQGNPSLPSIATWLAATVQQARRLNDSRTESYALGTLGSVYERSQQWDDAQQLSEQALLLAQNSNAPDISYRWQWQLGRLFKQKADAEPAAANDDYARAIASYSEAIDTLKGLRTDLITVNPLVQVSFQESIEPIHRQLVSLLLDPKRGKNDAPTLEKARSVIESLQLAELDNFLKEACLRAAPVSIDRVDARAAVIYPILLQDRLEVVVSLPNQQLRHYATAVSQDTVEDTISQLRRLLVLRVGQQYLPRVQQLYDWIIRPIEADLQSNQVKTLVFVLDGSLRNLPMAALHDGKQFLLQTYSVALTPGLQLLDARPLQKKELRVLTAGLSESRQGFSALPNVVTEVEQIRSTLPAQVLLNQQFTESALAESINFDEVPIVHMATHAKFSSDKDQTFILTWDERIGINALYDILQASNLRQSNPIELLVLSACQTASGDRQAALGLAGTAVRAGARSTIATLWQVNDEGTALLMNRLYEELSKGTPKAEALRLAQLDVLQVPRFRQHPYFWAPYILVGNWL